MPGTTSWPALHQAVHAGDRDAAAALASENPSQVTACTPQGDSPLHLAALSLDADMLQLLLQLPAPPPVDAKNQGDWTALMLVLLADGSKHGGESPGERRVACLLGLLRQGASIDPMSADGWNALLLSATRGDDASMACLLEQPGAASLLETRTAQGDTPLLLSSHRGSAGCVRQLLAAGASVDARNSRGLGAAHLAVNAACHAPAGDEATAAYEAVLRCVAAAGASLARPSPPAAKDGADGAEPRAEPTLLASLACAPAETELRRLMSMAAALRRCGCNETGGGGGGEEEGGEEEGEGSGEGGPPEELASALAMRRGRASLAALIRSPPPPPTPLLCMRVPMEKPPPSTVVVYEGGVDCPELAAEPPALRSAVLSATCPSADEASMGAGEAQGGPDREAQAEEEATKKVGGAVVKRRLFRLAARELPPTDEGAPPDLVQAVRVARAAVWAGRVAATASAGGAGEAVPPAGEAVPTRLPQYKQRRRWVEEEVELIEVRPSFDAPLLHQAHLAMLREALGDGFDAEGVVDAPPAERPWCLYTEEGGGGFGGAEAAVKLFSLDAPLLLAFAAEHEAEAAEIERSTEALTVAAGPQDESGESGESGDEAGLASMVAGGERLLTQAANGS